MRQPQGTLQNPSDINQNDILPERYPPDAIISKKRLLC
jgi:hypothetical protein